MQHVRQALRLTSGVVARRAATAGGAGRAAATVSAAGRGYSGRSGGSSRPQKQQQGYQQQRGPGRPQQGRSPGRFADAEPGMGRGRSRGSPPPPQQQQQQRRRPRSPEQQGRFDGNGSTPAAAAAAAAAAPQAPPAGLAAAVADQVSAFAATVPPRRQGVTDGRWDQADELAVKEALDDAEKLERQYAKHSGGEVILGRTLEELAALMASLGQPAYRAKQLRDGVMQGARSVHDITTLSKDLRAQLAERGVRTGRSVLHHSVSAADGTRKFLLQLVDGRVVETVGIPADDADRKRLTVGCPMRCTFCATGKGGFARNLLPHEIVDQVLTVQEEFGQRVSNIVFMGMGEPLLNLPSVLRAHEILNKDIGIGARHITISTVGVPNAIRRMGRLAMQSTLAVSIHAPYQSLREEIVPSARAYPLEALMADCQEYFRLSGRRVTFEYTLLSGVNDQLRHAEELAALLRRHDLRSHVNLIPWNPVDESEFQRPSRRAVQQFAAVLESAGVPVSLRNTRGLEAAAACGQLRNRHQKQPLEEFAVPT
ncbi:ribosomal RNA large subunit methyltransferase N isoform A [Chlorella sorokiniana]|uniref:Ribosomal RNA large subunit methyltransferase N isoform A n=1 Tax=Chlorella sorokiniana TaxID=3076 RepID=A0A2P6TGJ4_CHLSO|nr:ribosomal RNA large subunit methyltransferase N isoform A [Chlorella sorokiniana]|eukprot:PRW33242.1 ribosomal RNA large subunit methyltransferase N isoform A [Chlorella sorokiniana]